jgi:hypothetical protein
MRHQTSVRGISSLLLSCCLLVPLGCGNEDPPSGEGSSEGDSSEGSGASTSSSESESSSGSEAESGTETGEGSCYQLEHSIVADIDETLTTADSEFIQQLLDTTVDPLEREGASEMISAYHAMGYTVVYMTARAHSQTSSDDAMISAEELTSDWLMSHGFPFDENTRLEMADSFVFGDSAAEYKTERLGELQAAGHAFEYAYGNALSDITAYEAAGIPKGVTFIIGEEAGAEGTVAIEGEGWIDHNAAHLPTVTDWCEAG